MFMKILLALLRKDLLIEFRTKETIFVTIGMAILMSAIASVGVSAALLPPAAVKSVLPVLLTLSFLLSSTISMTRTYEYEYQDRPLQGLLMSGATPQLVFVSKFLTNFLTMSVGTLTTLLGFVFFLNLSIAQIFLPMTFIFGLMILGFVAIATLIVPITFSSRLRGVILPLLLLPLTFPILFGGIEICSSLIAGIPLDLSSPWISLLVGFDVLYMAIGMNLFDKVVIE